MTLVLPALAAPLLALALYAWDRHLRAARTRRQLFDALAAVPEVAGVAPEAHAERLAAVADALARAGRFDRRQRARVVAAARLSRLGHIAAPHDPALTPAAAGARVAAAAGLPADVVGLLAEVLGAPPGEAGPAAAVVRVAGTFESRLGPDRSVVSGALFTTLVDHHRGEERRAAEMLVAVVQGRAARV